MRLCPYDQLSQPDSDSVMLFSEELVGRSKVERSLLGEISVHAAMLLISMGLSEEVLTYQSDYLCKSKLNTGPWNHENV
jgi:hypothetical protein